MASNVEELTIRYEEDGIEIVKELDKKILSKGAWSTVVFRYQEWSRAKNEYGEEKYSVRRYRKMDGEYKPQSKFNISGKKQALQLIEILSNWAGK